MCVYIYIYMCVVVTVSEQRQSHMYFEFAVARTYIPALAIGSTLLHRVKLV